jgi:hypothetical protein
MNYYYLFSKKSQIDHVKILKHLMIKINIRQIKTEINLNLNKIT